MSTLGSALDRGRRKRLASIIDRLALGRRRGGSAARTAAGHRCLDSAAASAVCAAAGPVDAEQRCERARRDLAAAVRAVFGPIAPDYVVTEIIEGEPERALARKSVGADLLVLGSASARGPAGRPLGPVIRTCLSRAHCPVVVVGPEGLPGGGADPADPPAARQFAGAKG